jgi:RHS repeat-associated protein
MRLRSAGAQIALVTVLVFGAELPALRIASAQERRATEVAPEQGAARDVGSGAREDAPLVPARPANTTGEPVGATAARLPQRSSPGAEASPVPIPASRAAAIPPDATLPAAGAGAPVVASAPIGGDKTGVSSQAIALPQGAGKLQGMGESFSTQLSTGVATFSVPLNLERARGGAQPSLTLLYSSSAGHGLAGVGWDLPVPFVARQTDRGLPLYDDRAAWHPQQDRFVFGSGQELVPVCTVQGTSCPGALPGETMPAWADGCQYFRARVEGSYLRFFWSKDHRTWRVQSKSGETMELGVPLDGSGDAGALETAPDDAARIFRWNLARQYDNEGATPPSGALQPAPVNVVVYRYATFGGLGYLSDVFDTPPASNPTGAPLSQFAHHTHLVYATRPDPTFSYRRGWRTDRTQRLVAIDVSSAAFLAASATRHQVRRYHLTYDPAFHVSLLTGIALEGRCAGTGAGAGTGETAAPAEDPTTGLLPGGTGCAGLPPVTLAYQHVDAHAVDGSPASADLAGYEGFDERIIPMTASPPNSIDEDLTDLFDVNADGLPDVVVTTPGADSKFPLYLAGAGGVANAFGASRLGVLGVLGASSTQINLVNANIAVADIDGDGIVDWLHQPAVKSYAVYTPRLVGADWFMVGRAVPSSAQQDPHLDLGEDTPDIDVFDVNGDGLVDVVRTTGTEIDTFLSLGRFPGGDGNFGSAAWTGPASASLSLAPVTSCVPLAAPGVPVRFSDSAVRIADMNGDGLQDIVYVQPGAVQYWPGRGDGSWGTGALGACTSGFADGTSIAMSDSPPYSDPSGSALRLDDVNGDGLDDIVQVRFDAIDVWLNVDGAGFTPRHVIQGVTPASGPLWAGKVRLVDMNGSGTRDVVWGEGGSYRYVDLSGGQRPWVLTHIDNGLGKTTDIAYTTSVAQMLAAEAAGQAWTSKAPIPVHVVASVTERDQLPVAGGPGGSYVTAYTYRDAVYDGRQREFRGFRAVVSTRAGDDNSPTSSTSTGFLLGDCADDEPPPAGLTSRCTPAGRWADNVREALKGLPVVTEEYDGGSGGARVYKSTEHHQYTLRSLYTGLDGREVRAAFDSQDDTWRYDTSPFAPASSSPGLSDVVLDRIPGPEPSAPVALTQRAAAGAAHVQSSHAVDVFGNATVTVASGCVDGAACAFGVDGRVEIDDVIRTVTTPEQIAPWVFRTAESYVIGLDGVRRNDTFYAYDNNGRLTATTAQLAGSMPLDRFHQTAGAATAGNSAPGASAQSGRITLKVAAYDPFGNVASEAAPNGRCRDIVYASDYADLATSETLHVGSIPAATGSAPVCAANGQPTGPTPLTTTAGYDRGLGAVVGVVDVRQEPSLVQYDSLGRVVALTKPSAAPRVLSANASVLVDYDLATPSRPYSIVHTRSSIGASEADPTYRDAFTYVDGMGRTRVIIEQADPSAGDPAPFIASGVTTFDAKAASQRVYLAAFYGGDARAFPLASAPSVAYTRQRYDAFGRELEAFALDGAVALQSAYHALTVDKYDAADLSPGPHEGTPASVTVDGHGRTVVVTERAHQGGAVELRRTRTKFLSTGQPQVVTRTRAGSSDVVRWAGYDTLGRMVLNVEPDATLNVVPLLADPTLLPATTKAWRYAYDDNGDLVGTSDARGCGANYLYDAAGRILAEDYSPCLAAQATYSAPDLTTGNGTEVLYTYDALDADASHITCLPGNTACFPVDATLLPGRLAMVSDRGAKTVTRYDGRGRVTGTARRIVAPGVPSDTLSARYAPHWYTQTTGYDGADRPVTASTGVDSDIGALLDANLQSVVTTKYSARNTVASVGSGYGPIVAGVTRDADGPITQIVYGDAAPTTSAFSFDARRRMSSVQTYRGAPAIWSSPPVSYQPPPDTLRGDAPSTLQLLLEDVDYAYDDVDNPIEIDDFRNPAEWPAGAQPVSRSIHYDDLYRVTEVDYASPGGSDTWVSPFDAEDKRYGADVRRGAPAPHVSFARRVISQSIQYDWLGNTTRTDDDAHGFYDRSLGAITNGAATAGPYQIQSATGSDPALGGHLTAAYDSAGNLATLTVARSGPCLPSAASCAQQYLYDWDEVGRLVRARRTDGTQATPTADLSYAYDASDQRTLKTAVTSGGTPAYTAFVFGSLELRRTTWTGTDYTRTSSTEVAYLFAHGERLARLHYALASEPALASGKLHVVLELPDHLGSASIVVDRDTGELVERSTYTAAGGADSDYRPARWNAFREDYRFTGKEEDVEVGIQYFGKRYYAPALGRWISPDPLTIHGLGADANAYAYVHGSLLSAADPDGLMPPPATRGTTPESNWHDIEPYVRPYMRAWSAFAQGTTDAVEYVTSGFMSHAEREAARREVQEHSSELHPLNPGPQGDLDDAIVRATPGAAANAWMSFAGALRAYSAPAAVPISVESRASEALRAVRDAGKEAGLAGVFNRASNTAVFRGTINGQTMVLVAVKVPNIVGNLADAEAAVAQWAKANVLREGEQLAGVSVTRTHADVVLIDNIVKVAKAAGVDPKEVTGELAAGTPVCDGCQGHAADQLPGVKVVNPKPE